MSKCQLKMMVLLARCIPVVNKSTYRNLHLMRSSKKLVLEAKRSQVYFENEFLVFLWCAQKNWAQNMSERERGQLTLLLVNIQKWFIYGLNFLMVDMTVKMTTLVTHENRYDYGLKKKFQWVYNFPRKKCLWSNRKMWVETRISEYKS